MRKITLSEYNAIPENYRGIWTVERWDLPDWAEIRKRHIGKRTMMVYDKGTCLLVEGIGFEIVDDSGWKKPDEIRKDIDMLYQEFCNMRKCTALCRLHHTLAGHSGYIGNKNCIVHGFRYGMG